MTKSATPLVPPAAPLAADALLLTCMDFRFIDAVAQYMNGRGLRGKYNHVALASASLAATTEERPHWRQTFWAHLDLAVNLHNIHTVIIIDHCDCRAYRLILGDDHMRDAASEKAAHAVVLNKLRAMINREYPALKVETLFMAQDGGVEVIREISGEYGKIGSDGGAD